MQCFDTTFIHHIARHHGQIRPTGLHALDCFHHTHRITVRSINDHCINLLVGECLNSLLEVVTDPHCRRHTQATRRVARGVGKLLAFHDVFHRDEPAQATISIDQRQFFNSMALQQQFCLVERGAFARSHQTFTGHELAYWSLIVAR